MTPTYEYQFISDTAPAVTATLSTLTSDGWRPILMSTAASSGPVQVSIILERPIPAPYTK